MNKDAIGFLATLPPGTLEIAIAFLLKLLDNIFGTFKTILVSKERYLLGALFNALGTLFFLVAMVRVSQSSNNQAIIAMCIATFLGTYIPGLITNKTEKDKLYIFDITAKTMETGISLSSRLKELGIAIRTETAYNENTTKTLVCKVYSPTKVESSQVIDILNSQEYKGKLKWHVYSPVETQ